MSSSYRERRGGFAPDVTDLRRRWLWTSLLAISAPGMASAANYQVQPNAEMSAETHTNRSLEPEGPELDESTYRAEVGVLLGISTPRSSTTVQPRLRFQYSPDRDDQQHLDGFLDFSSNYSSERSRFRVFGRYEHQDLADAELAGAGFDDADPEDPTSPETGRVTVGQSVDRAQIRPDYIYSISERFGIGARGQYEIARYDKADEQIFRNEDYDYALGEGYVAYVVSPKTDVALGVYASTYEARELSTTTDAIGVSFDVRHRWTESFQTSLELAYERDDFEELDIQVPNAPVVLEDSGSSWSALLTGVWKGEISSVRFTGGRLLSPGGEGVKKESDQIRIQYHRELGPRLGFDAAGRYNEERPLRLSTEENFRQYARGELTVDWLMTQRWYLTGGYRYTWQKYRSDPSDADDHAFFISVGYRGLPIETADVDRKFTTVPGSLY